MSPAAMAPKVPLLMLNVAVWFELTTTVKIFVFNVRVRAVRSTGSVPPLQVNRYRSEDKELWAEVKAVVLSNEVDLVPSKTVFVPAASMDSC